MIKNKHDEPLEWEEILQKLTSKITDDGIIQAIGFALDDL
jgi:hypothetical protein